MARVLVVDDQRAVAEALAERLRTEPDVGEVVPACDLDDASRQLEGPPFDIAIIDLDLNGQDGLILASMIRERHQPTHLMVIGEPDNTDAASEAVRLGVRGYAIPSMSTRQLVEQMRGLVRGESHFPPALLTDVFAQLTHTGHRNSAEELVARLTPREREVLACMAAGLDRSTIADEFDLSINTVRTHAKNLLAKLGVHSSIEAVNIALRARLTPAVLTMSGQQRPE